MRWSPAPYSLSIIPRLLHLEIVDGEHFVTSDMLSLLAGCAPLTRDLEAEASHRDQASRALFVPSTSTIGDSSSASPGPGRDERGIRPTMLPLLRKGTCSAPRVSQIRKKGTGRVKSTPGARDGSGSGESGYSSKPVPFGSGMDYTYWTVDVYGDTRINPRGDGGGDGLTLTPAPYRPAPPRPRYPLN